MARRRGQIHDRITAAIYGDPAPLTQWAMRLGMRRGTLDHRLSGRTPWSLDEALTVAYHLGTTVDALRDGSFVPSPPRTSRGVTRPHGRPTEGTLK